MPVSPNPSAITVGSDVIEYGSAAIAAGIDLVAAGNGPARMIRVDDTSSDPRR